MSLPGAGLRYALRGWRREPGFAAAAILTVALAVGANTAIFSLFDAVALRPLPYRDPERLFLLEQTIPQWARLYPRIPVNVAQFLALEENCRALESAAIVRPAVVPLTHGGETGQVNAVRVSSRLFDLLGVRPALGRGFRPGEEWAGARRVTLLTDSLWRNRFGGDPGVLGREVSVGGRPYTIVGVLPPDLRFFKKHQLGMLALPPRVDLFLPLDEAMTGQPVFGDFNYAMLVRLRPEATAPRAAAEASALLSALAAGGRHPETRARLSPLREQVAGKTRGALAMLLAAAAAVLLMSCANLANLLLARITARWRESAIRSALGASRSSLIWQTLTESLSLALAGGALGVALAWVGLRWLVWAAPVDLPRLEEAALDLRALAFALGASLLTGALFGILPAWRASRAEPQSALRAGGRSATASTRGLLVKRLLVGFETGLGVMLLVTAALLVTSFARLVTADKGFTEDAVVGLEVVLPEARYQRLAERLQIKERLIEAVAALPGVASAGVSNTLPLQGEVWLDSIGAEGNTAPPAEWPLANYRPVNPDYFRTLGIPLRQGRLFSEADRERNLALVSETTARRMWPGQDPVGKRFRHANPADPPFEVAGVVGDIRGIRLDQDPGLMVYVPHWKRTQSRISLLVRTPLDPAALSGALREAVRKLDPEAAVAEVKTMRSIVEESTAERRFQVTLAAAFALAALALAALGVYGVVSYSVASRINEMGIRLALGAGAGRLYALVLWQGMLPVAAGIAAGVAGALAAGSLLRSLLFGVNPHDPLTIAFAVALLGAVAGAACWLPARRAVRVDPAVALRAE